MVYENKLIGASKDIFVKSARFTVLFLIKKKESIKAAEINRIRVKLTASFSCIFKAIRQSSELAAKQIIVIKVSKKRRMFTLQVTYRDQN